MPEQLVLWRRLRKSEYGDEKKRHSFTHAQSQLRLSHLLECGGYGVLPSMRGTEEQNIFQSQSLHRQTLGYICDAQKDVYHLLLMLHLGLSCIFGYHPHPHEISQRPAVLSISPSFKPRTGIFFVKIEF